MLDRLKANSELFGDLGIREPYPYKREYFLLTCR
jgi:hypothetical protein